MCAREVRLSKHSPRCSFDHLGMRTREAQRGRNLRVILLRRRRLRQPPTWLGVGLMWCGMGWVP